MNYGILNRYLFSATLAAIITVLLFVLMILLIKVEHLQLNENFSRRVRVIIQPVVIDEAVIETLKKPNIKAVDSPPASASIPINNKKAAKPNSPINTPVPKPKIKIDLTTNNDNFGEHVAINLPGAFGNSGQQNSGFGFVTGTEASLKTFCTIGFYYNTQDGVTDFQWYNCKAEMVTELSEKKLYSWLQENPNQLAKYQQKPDVEILVTFSTNSLN